MYSVDWPAFTMCFATLVFIEHFALKSVAAVVTAEAYAFSHE